MIKNAQFIIEILLWIQEEFEDTKGVGRIRKSNKDRQHHGQHDKQQSAHITYKTKPTEQVYNKCLLYAQAKIRQFC